MSDTTPVPIEPVTNKIVRKTMSYMDENKATFNERQLVALVSSTPKYHVKTRPGKGGKTFRYVSGSYVQNKLNQVFGWGWSFEVKQFGVSPKGSSVFVLGKLTVLDSVSKQVLVTKEQFGSAEIKYEKSGKELNYADDLKSAATDSLKKSASLLGIAADIYADPETAKTISDTVSKVVEYQKNKMQADQDAQTTEEVTDVDPTND